MALGRKRKHPQTEKNRKIKQQKKQWRLQRNERRVARRQQKILDRMVSEIDALEVLENFDRGVSNPPLSTVHSDENEHIEAEDNGKFEVIARLDKLENQLIARRNRLSNSNTERVTVNVRLQAVKRIRVAYDKWSNKQQPPEKVKRKLIKKKLQHKKNSRQHIQSDNHASVPDSHDQQLALEVAPNPVHNNEIVAPVPDDNLMDADIDDNALSKNIFMRWDDPGNRMTFEQLWLLGRVIQDEQNKRLVEFIVQRYINNITFALLYLTATETAISIVVFEAMQAHVSVLHDQLNRMMLKNSLSSVQISVLSSNEKKKDSVKTDDGQETPGSTKRDDETPGKNETTDNKLADRHTIVDDDQIAQQEEEDNALQDQPGQMMGEMPMELDNDADDDIAEAQPGLKRDTVDVNPVNVQLDNNDEEDIEGTMDATDDAAHHTELNNREPQPGNRPQQTDKEGENSADEEEDNSEIAHTYRAEDNDEEREYEADDENNIDNDSIPGTTHEPPQPAAIEIDRKQNAHGDTLESPHIETQPDPYDADIEDSDKTTLTSTSKMYNILHKISEPTKGIKDKFDGKIKVGQTQYFKSTLKPISEGPLERFSDDVNEENRASAYCMPG